MTFTAFQERTKDLASHERLQVFGALPQSLQDEAWATHAEWVGQRTLEAEWISSDMPYGFAEWCGHDG